MLACAEGESNNAIAVRLKMTKQTVGRWRTRFIARRIAGLYDNVHLGPARTIDDERMAHLIKATLHTKPSNGSTHWSVRTVAAETAISKTSVQRYLRLLGPQPRRTEGFRLSDDPLFTGRGRPVPEPAGQCAGDLCGREEPAPGAGARAPASNNLCGASITSSRRTTRTARPSGGPPPQIQSLERRINFAHVSAGQTPTVC